MKDVKTFLREVRHEQLEILDLRGKIESLEKSLLPGGIRYDIDKVQNSTSDKINDMLAQLGDFRTELEKDLSRLIENESAAMQMIQTLNSSEQRRVLTKYYLSNPSQDIGLPTWEDVANNLHFSIQHVHRLHGEALKELNQR